METFRFLLPIIIFVVLLGFVAWMIMAAFVGGGW